MEKTIMPFCPICGSGFIYYPPQTGSVARLEYFCGHSIQGAAPNTERGKCTSDTTDKPDHEAQ